MHSQPPKFPLSGGTLETSLGSELLVNVYLFLAFTIVECFINKMKQYRRISSRFDKLAARYMGFLSFVATIIWLR